MQRKYEYWRKLPHYQPDNKAFFVTFATHSRWILPEAVRQIVIDTCLAGNGKKFRLYGIVVMPDHVHLVMIPLADANGPISIAGIMQAIKGASAHLINKALGRKGGSGKRSPSTVLFVGKRALGTSLTTSSEILSLRDL
jgi:REP element-mobilizing transposase RayT